VRGMVLAAGFGTRMRPITQAIPKPLLPTGEGTLLEVNLRYLAEQGCDTIVVNTHHLGSRIHEALRSLDRSGLPEIRISDEETILGTGGGIARAAAWLDSDPVVITNVDLLFRPSLRQALLVQADADGKPLATLVCVKDAAHAQIRAERARVTAILPWADPSDPALWAFTGIYLLSAEAIARLRTRAGGGFLDIVPEFRAWLDEGRLAFTSADRPEFLESGSPEAYLELLRATMGAGFALVEPEARVSPGAVIHESVVMNGAVVEAGASLDRVILGPGARARGAWERCAAAGEESIPLRLLERAEETPVRAFLASLAEAAGPEGPAPEPGQPGRERRMAKGEPTGPASPGARTSLLRLHGDGSNRRIVRVTSAGRSRILVMHRRATSQETVVYPRREGAEVPSEIATFVYVRGVLHARGVRVPAICGVDEERGYLLVEDLGDRHLFDLVRPVPGRSDGNMLALYREALATCAAMRSAPAGGSDTPGGFDPVRTHNLPYDPPFARRYESGYFERGLLPPRGGRPDGGATNGGRVPVTMVDRDALDRELDRLAEESCRGWNDPGAFIHRDFQSRNLMVTSTGLAVIDFQGARTGPPEYDLASLLFDPYVMLPADLRHTLFGEAQDAAGGALSPGRFRACAIQRMMQALGAYAYLGWQAGKPEFLSHLPAALDHLIELTANDYPVLHATARALAGAAQIRAATAPPAG